MCLRWYSRKCCAIKCLTRTSFNGRADVNFGNEFSALLSHWWRHMGNQIYLLGKSLRDIYRQDELCTQ